MRAGLYPRSRSEGPLRWEWAEGDSGWAAGPNPGGASLRGVSEPLSRFHAVIPAGGAGTRLWPLSRAGAPKFLHDLTGSGRTLIRETVERVEPLAGDRILVVTGARHAEAIRDQLPALGPDQMLIEPSPRDSMAAIGWAAAVLEARDPDAILGSFAADHVIQDRPAFERSIAEAIDLADTGRLVTIGITPTYPATGFGYIQSGRPVAGARTALHVRQFVEKPSATQAAAYLATGEFRWNAGMFVVRAGRLLDLLALRHPHFAADLRRLARIRPGDDFAAIWDGLPKIAIDHAVAEPAADDGEVLVVPGAFGWDDIGDFTSLAAILPAPASGPRVLGDPAQVTAIDSTGLVAPGSGRAVALLGVQDIVVIDTEDALLVTTAARAQEVKALVDALRERGRTDLL